MEGIGREELRIAEDFPLLLHEGGRDFGIQRIGGIEEVRPPVCRPAQPP